MPIYTCTIAESTLSADTKHALAGEIARIHSSINHAPSTYVNVAFHELAADGLHRREAGTQCNRLARRACAVRRKECG
jgi:phenylpyruvate tautomerase PptA (4-oxalocrotonate tautomerase family)